MSADFLGVAFDPAYATNGRFYVYYNGAQGDIFVDRFTVSTNPDVANTTSDRVITVQHRANSNHNGGLLLFGADGMFYLGIGDGGGAGDVPNNAQNINVLLGKILRLNVTALPYTIPAGNPFVGQAGANGDLGVRTSESVAFRVRRSARWLVAKLYIANVGQGAQKRSMSSTLQPPAATMDGGQWKERSATTRPAAAIKRA